MLRVNGIDRTMVGPVFWFHFPDRHIAYIEDRQALWFHRYIAFQGRLMQTWISAGLIHDRPVFCPLDEVSSMAHAFDRILELCIRGTHRSQVQAINSLENLLLDLEAFRNIPSAPTPSLVEIVEAYIQDHRYAPPGYAPLARQLGMAESTLRRKFREATGGPIHQFTENLRIREARRLLDETDTSIADIAASLHYSDIYYFSRHFRKLAGQPPATYRRQQGSAAP